MNPNEWYYRYRARYRRTHDISRGRDLDNSDIYDVGVDASLHRARASRLAALGGLDE